MKESQVAEFKSIWRDEHLKHICAFANTRGGSLFVGVGDDGTPVGAKDTKKLLEDIPNKALSLLGIYVNLVFHKKNEKEYIEIVVQPNTVPISLKGVFYVRSGSTTQELKGAYLQEFILKKMGRSFDDLPLMGTSIADIDEKPIRKFLQKATTTNRLAIDPGLEDIKNILFNLRLINDRGELKNAVILLFGKDPLRFFSSVSFRIGRFGTSDHDLRFQDVIEGNIFEMPDRVMEILRAKYLISPIRYEGLQRIEELEYPEEALREAI